MLRSIGPMEWLVIIVAFMVLFGGKKLADVGKGLGEGIRNFKQSVKGEETPVPPDEKKQA